MENRITMQIFIVFSILAINISPAAGDDNSTQVIYLKLTVDESAHAKITEILTSFWNQSWTVNNITETANCNLTVVGTNTTCKCMSGYRWNSTVCQPLQCCDNITCSFSQSPDRMCIADTTINVAGSISLGDLSFQDCLSAKDSNSYRACNHNLTQQIQRVYSTLTGFDALTVVGYRVGSIIANFQMVVVSAVSSQALVAKSNTLTNNLNATMTLTTTGVVQIHMPQNPVEYNSAKTINCTSLYDLGTNPTWTLQQQGVVYNIYNGTQATVTADTGITTVQLRSITELWNGTYTCAYQNNSASLNITHQASAVMDVALLPNITISTAPQFPHCTSSNDLLPVQINCNTAQIGENYTVLWNSPDITAAIIPVPYSSGQNVYSASTYVSCTSVNPNVTCTFTNRRSQTRSATVTINIIHVGDKFCAGDGVWLDTKANFTAVLPCSNAAGQMQRTCSNEVWANPVSGCVLQTLYNVLQKSEIVDIGLGLKNENGAIVFSQLQNVTTNSADINTNSNLNATVQVLKNLEDRLDSINTASAVNDFVTSSSNILNTTNTSWISTNNNNNDNKTLPESYMTSVENLIKKANISNSQIKPNVEARSCSSPGCHNVVFKCNVTLGSSVNGTVKTTGFQNLQYLLPSTNNTIPNTIVVSTTTDASHDSVQITIDFELFQSRPRNVELKCVAWNNNTSSWSSDGCQWLGASSPGRCVCSHLSSFAILMSKTPIEVAGATEITNAGLAVSVISLLISLMIEIIVWSTVVKTNTLYLRHTAHFNISLCLLIADCCFLASSIGEIPPIWCQISVVLKHFCYLAMFFWMLCLSITLLHQAVYLFHNVSKTSYLRFSLVLGYACPFLIVFITFITNNTGAEGSYYSKDGCWLVYNGLLQGSIYTFVIPVGIIIFINVFSMLVVIMKLLDHPKMTDKSHDKEKNAAKTVMRTVILLTPIFGVTWGLGFAVMIFDLTSGTAVLVVNYAFILLNAFQGFFILLTTCIGDRMVRETLLSCLRRKAPASVSESTTKLDSSLKN